MRNLLFLIFCFLAISCSNNKKKFFFNTEISCPDGSRVLIRYARLQEIKMAIIRADKEKKESKTSEKYTVIRLPDTRSLKIENIPPEDMIKCSLYEMPIKHVDENYIKYIY